MMSLTKRKLNDVIIPDTGNEFTWSNIERIKKNKKYKNKDFNTIQNCMNQTPDLAELICTCSRVVPTDYDNEICLSEIDLNQKIRTWNGTFDKFEKNIFNINVTTRGCVTISLSKQEGHYALIQSKNMWITNSSNLSKKFQIIGKKYWEKKKKDGTPRDTFWKWSSLYDFYHTLSDWNLVETFSTELQRYLISNI